MAKRTLGPAFPWLALVVTVVVGGCVTPGTSRYEDPAQSAYDQGLSRYHSGDLEGAVDAFRRAAFVVENGEFSSDVHYHLGRALLDLGRSTEALDAFARARSATDRDVKLFRCVVGQADAHYLVRDWTRAAAAYRESLAFESDPGLLDPVYYRLAVSLQRSGRIEDARKYHSLVRSFVPDYGEPRFDADAVAKAPTPREPVLSGGFSGPIASRSEWGARPTRANHDRMTRIHRVTIHHSALESDASTKSAAAREIQGIQRAHQDHRHWADIGYHFVIDRSGRIWEGRPLEVQGAHAGNSDLNRGNVGIVLLGDFDHQAVSSGQGQSLDGLVSHLMERYGFGISQVHTHGELKPTGCPGHSLQAYVDSMRRRLSGRRSRPPMASRGHVDHSGHAHHSRGHVDHVVGRGETLFAIARKYGVTVADLQRANPRTVQGSRVMAGYELRIPASAP